MAVSPYKLETQELINKAQITLDKVTITQYQKEVLSAVVHRLAWIQGQSENTTRWAQEAFVENERLIQLLRDRWEAGWIGDKKKVTPCEP